MLPRGDDVCHAVFGLVRRITGSGKGPIGFVEGLFFCSVIAELSSGVCWRYLIHTLGEVLESESIFLLTLVWSNGGV